MSGATACRLGCDLPGAGNHSFDVGGRPTTPATPVRPPAARSRSGVARRRRRLSPAHPRGRSADQRRGVVHGRPRRGALLQPERWQLAGLVTGVWTAQNLEQDPRRWRSLQRNEVAGPAVVVQWTVGPSPRSWRQGHPRSRARQKKGKPGPWILTTSYDRKLEKPAARFRVPRRSLATIAPVRSRTAAPEGPSMTPKPAWVCRIWSATAPCPQPGNPSR